MLKLLSTRYTPPVFAINFKKLSAHIRQSIIILLVIFFLLSSHLEWSGLHVVQHIQLRVRKCYFISTKRVLDRLNHLPTWLRGSQDTESSDHGSELTSPAPPHTLIAPFIFSSSKLNRKTSLNMKQTASSLVEFNTPSWPICLSHHLQ